MTRTFAIGDIHGCYDELESLLDLIEMEWEGGTIVFLGDYIDRGPECRRVVERIMAGPSRSTWRWIALKGNHEAMMVSAVRGDDRWAATWRLNGGEQTLQSFGGTIPTDVVEWADRLPPIHVDDHRVFVHAGIDDGVALDAQDEHTLLWKRPLPDISGNYGGRHLVHGHTPLAENPATTGNRTNLDSACVFGGSLSAAVFDDTKAGAPVRLISIPNRSHT